MNEIVGIEFKMKDGTKESFDPVDSENPFDHEGELYLINHTHNRYELKSDEVESFRIYPLCKECGQEEVDGECTRYNCSECQKGIHDFKFKHESIVDLKGWYCRNCGHYLTSEEYEQI